MLRCLSARSPLLLRVVLTGLSALAVITVTSGFTLVPASQSLSTASPSVRSASSTLTNKDVQLESYASHVAHMRHEAHLSHVAWLKLQAENAAKAKLTAHVTVSFATPAYSSQTVAPRMTDPGAGTLTAAQVGQLWLEAGGPAWAEGHAEEIAACESGYRTDAYNPSGATGLWQILGAVVSGNLNDPLVNAENAVAKFKASGDTFAQWVCR